MNERQVEREMRGEKNARKSRGKENGRRAPHLGARATPAAHLPSRSVYVKKDVWKGWRGLGGDAGAEEWMEREACKVGWG